MAEKKKSDLSRAFTEDGALKTHVGGQALIEGIMMRGKFNWAAAIRQADGEIYVEEHDLASGKKKNSWMYWPLVRGCTALIESLALSFKALEIATAHAYDDEAFTYHTSEADKEKWRKKDAEAAAKAEAKRARKAAKSGQPIEVEASDASAEDASEGEKDAGSEEESFEFGKGEMVVSMVLGIVMGIALFILVPALIANLLVGEYDSKTLLWNIVDGLMRVGIFVFYIWLIGRMKDIKIMFGYHGAEHKTIHCFEHGLPLTPENARSFPRLHVRCGTAFLIMVMIIAILVYTILPLNPIIAALGIPNGALKFLFVVLIRIVFMPLIAGISYEITVKWAGTHPDNPLVKVILWPGMQMQYLTTNEPDDGQLECAIAAMKRVLEREEREAAEAAEAEAAATA